MNFRLLGFQNFAARSRVWKGGLGFFLSFTVNVGSHALTEPISLSSMLVISRQKQIMGTIAQIQLKGPLSSKGRLIEISSQAFQAMENLDLLLSGYRPQSPLSRLNRQGHLDQAHPDLLLLIRKSRSIEKETGGAFDMTLASLTMGAYHFKELNRLDSSELPLPTPQAIAQGLKHRGSRYIKVHGRQVTITQPGVGLDLGGIAKGFAVDRAMALIQKKGAFIGPAYSEQGTPGEMVRTKLIQEAQVSLSGDIRCWGSCWIRIQNPFVGCPSTGSCKMETRPYIADFRFQGHSEGHGRQLGVSTSGGYGRYAGEPSFHHLIDPQTGHSVSHVASVTLVGSISNATLDAWATALAVMPLKKLRHFLAVRPSLSYLIVFPDGRVESNLERNPTLTDLMIFSP